MDQITTFVQDNETALIIIGGALVVLLLAWLTARAVRRREVEPEDTGPVIRRPLYADEDLLDELRAHVPTTHGGTGLVEGATATTLDDGTPRAEPPSPRSVATRKLNDTLDALQRATVTVLNDLDDNPEHELAAGQAVLLTGTLRRHPATDAVEILELAAPLLIRNQQNGSEEPEDATTLTRTPPVPEVDPSGPLIVKVDHPATKRGLLMVLRRDNILAEDPFANGEVTILAVVDRVIGRRETVEVDDYLAPHLSPAGREVLQERDLADTIATLSEVTREDLGAKELRLRGPGAILTPASIHH